MTNRELSKAIAARFGVADAGRPDKTTNRAIRTLPGGNELLDAIESTNAARNHASRAGATDRVVAQDAAIDNLEAIRDAMAAYVIKESTDDSS